MCGIVGSIVFNDGGEVSESLLTRMRDTMTHRGPDGGGIWLSPNRRVGLGHRRLSIVDLSTTASQPMGSADGNIWLTFNGEIYNHAQLRAQLTKLAPGRPWKTDHSDTEVLLRAYEQWGMSCVEHLRGMFAFGIWDERTRELWLVRDRIGVKPLYFTRHHGRLSFASEIKALLEDPQQPRQINERALFHYLSFLTSPAPETLFDGICKLPAGSWLKVSETGHITEQRYWDVLDHTADLSRLSEDDMAAQLLEQLRESVALRKVADVPVGVFLSGGIDSSTNAALFTESREGGAAGPVKTFCIGYEGQYDSYQNETHYARMMAERLGAEHYEKLLTADDLIDFLPQMIYLQDEPIGDPVCVPVYYVSKLARDNGVIVCQVGEGSDELFWGYPYWKLMLNLQKADNLPAPRLLKRMGLAALRASGRERAVYTEWLRRGAAGVPVFWGGAEAFTETQKQHILGQRLRSEFRGMTSWDALAPIHQRFLEKTDNHHPLQWMTYLDLNLRLPELLLMRVDKMSMGVSLEARVPFLDHKFVEFAMSLPPEVKTRGGELKHILKKSVRGLVPDELIDRPKQGFGVPVYEWLFGRLGEEAGRTLRKFCGETGLFDAAAVDEMLSNNRGAGAWYLLNVAKWWERYLQ